MNRPTISFAAILVASATMLAFAACTTTSAETPSAAPQEQPKAAPMVVAHNSMAFPTGDKSTSAIMLEKRMPEQIFQGRSFGYSMVVTNLTDMTLESVRISESLPENFTLTGSSPYEAVREGSNAIWTIPSIGPRASVTLDVTGTADSGAQFATCAEVTYRSKLCASAPIVAPAIALAVSLAPSSDICTTTSIVYTVSNNGSATLTNVTVEPAIPAGLAVVGGDTNLRVNSLAPGASEKFTINVKPSAKGEYTVAPTAASAEGVSAKATATTTAGAPALAASATAPEQVLIVRTITYDIGVTNTGNTTAGATTLSASLPGNAKFVSATQSGRVDGNNVVWEMASLAPSATDNYSFTVKPEQAGVFSTTVRAANDCAGTATAAAQTTVTGIPALLLEVADLNDPVAVGDNVTYEIVVTNQGSARATNVVVTCELEDNETYVSATGETAASVSGQTISMAPVSVIEIGAKVVYHVTVKAVKAGDTRFKTTMTANELTRPVQETESTNLY